MKHGSTVGLALLGLASMLAVIAPLAQNGTSSQPNAKFQLPATDDGLPGQGPIRRKEWFKKLWAERRAKWAETAAQDHNAIVMLGDSITHMWGDDFSSVFPGLKVINRGISGDTTRGVLIRLQEDVLSLDPLAVVLLIGTNDLEQKADPDTITGNLKLILAAMTEHNPKMPIILCQVFPSSTSQSRPADQIKKLNSAYAAAVKGNAHVIFLETWPLFANSEGDASPSEFPDLLHPNQAGYTKWAAALRPIFATLGYLETNNYDFTPEPGFVKLFDGKDLSGWSFRPSSNTISFGEETSTPDGRFVAKNGRLIVTTPPEGRRIQQLSTTADFAKDFVLRLEFRATPNADSGIFIRGKQLQCRDYPIAGPYKQLKNYRSGEWNEIEVTVKDGVANCLCNGEVLEAALKVPNNGPIGLEGDRGQMEYRRIRLRELQ